MTLTAATAYDLIKLVSDIAVDKGMLTSQQVAGAKFRASTKSARSRGGRHNGQPWMSINIGSSVKGPQDLPKLAIWANNTKPSSQSHWSYKAAIQAANEGLYTFIEYPSYATDPMIGDFTSDDPVACLAVLVAHEMAHVVNYNTTDNRFKGRSHGEGFKKVYRILRQAVVDHLLVQPVKIVADKPKPVQVATAPRRPGAVRTVWDTCATLENMPRAYVMRMLADMGINKNTAARQYSEWNKAGRPTTI